MERGNDFLVTFSKGKILRAKDESMGVTCRSWSYAPRSATGPHPHLPSPISTPRPQEGGSGKAGTPYLLLVRQQLPGKLLGSQAHFVLQGEETEESVTFVTGERLS